jgi:hypothetical protein
LSYEGLSKPDFGNIQEMKIMRRLKLLWCAGMLVALVGGCVTPAKKLNWSLNSASRSDGVITLTTDYNPAQRAFWRPEEQNNLAIEKCAIWGYKGAQAFGQIQSGCRVFNQYGKCVRMQMTAKYQCVGSPSP